MLTFLPVAVRCALHRSGNSGRSRSNVFRAGYSFRTSPICVIWADGLLLAAMNHYAGGTFAEKVVSYVGSLGFTRAEIDRFVELMTEKVDGIIAGRQGEPL